jgi:hypothetical protein
MLHKFDVVKIIALLNKNPIVSKANIVMVDEIENRGFYKLHCLLIPSSFKLDLKFIKTEHEFIYSYQLYTHMPIARWDNEPHYPNLVNYPHHYHYRDKVESFGLSGKPEKDIMKIFAVIPEIISEY